jgi:hypothetical protein
MKKLVVMLTLAGLSSFCFAQSAITLSPSGSKAANDSFKSHYAKVNFTLPLPPTTVLFAFGTLNETFNAIIGSVDCENAIDNTLEALVEESGYNVTPFSTDSLEKRIIAKATKNDEVFLWSIKYGYFIVNVKNDENKLEKVYACYGFDLNKNDHIKLYDKDNGITEYDENGKVIVSGTSYYPPIKK